MTPKNHQKHNHKDNGNEDKTIESDPRDCVSPTSSSSPALRELPSPSDVCADASRPVAVISPTSRKVAIGEMCADASEDGVNETAPSKKNKSIVEHGTSDASKIKQTKNTSLPLSGNNASGMLTLSELEDRITYKTGIGMNDTSTTETHQQRQPPSLTSTSTSTPSLQQKGAHTAQPRPSASTKQHNNTVSSETKQIVSSDGEKHNLVDSLAHLTGIPVEAIEAAKQKKEKLGGTDQDSLVDSSDLENQDRLAVAVAIDCDEEDAYIPSAVEYNPDSKPPIVHNRRFRLYSLLLCTFLLVIIAGSIALALQQKSSNKKQNEKSKEASIEDSLDVEPGDALLPEDLSRPGARAITEQIKRVVGSEVLLDTSGSYYRAMEWILNEDPMQLTPNDLSLIQRYLLVVIYFKLHEDGDWLSCNAPTPEEPDDFCLFESLASIFPLEYRSVPDIRWLSSEHECEWAGLECDEFSQLTGIYLPAHEISGTLPVELGEFAFLQNINLSWNSFRGTIPSEFGKLRHLLGFEMHYNELTGKIPSVWRRGMSLRLLNLSVNQLTGPLPLDLFEIDSLKGMFLFENMLSGPIPSEIGQLSLLTFLRIQRNFFSGTLPTEIGLISPQEVWLHRLPIEGTIPSEIGNMKGTVDLRLHSTALGGPIPEQLFNLTKLFRIDLQRTQITGTLSPDVAKLTGLNTLRLRDTAMTGTIPSELAVLPLLDVVWLDGSDFVGSIHDDLCILETPVDVVADCLDSASTGLPQVNCTCCRTCCDHDTGLCEDRK